MIKYILFGILLFNSTPVIAQTGPAGGGGVASHYACVNNPGRGYVNLRSRPSTGAGVIKGLGHGTLLYYLSEARGNDGFIWLKVRAAGAVGWVRSDYACLN